MSARQPNRDLWTATIPTITQVLHLAQDLCLAIPVSESDPTISEDHKSQVQAAISVLNGPDRRISWQQTMQPRDRDDSSTFSLFPDLPTELRLRIWRQACDDLRFPGGLGSGRVPVSVYGEPLGMMFACRESKAVLNELITKCPSCFGTWITLKGASKGYGRENLWRNGMVFVKGSKIPCMSCDIEGSGSISMRIRYLMQYGNIWSEGKYHSTFLLMGKRLENSDSMTFIMPHFVEDLAGKGYLRKISILQEDPGLRDVYTSVLAPEVGLLSQS